jgi:hypothetical protein
MTVTEAEFDPEALFTHLTLGQWQQLDALDAAYVELLWSASSPTKADVEARAEAVAAFYDGLARANVKA